MKIKIKAINDFPQEYRCCAKTISNATKTCGQEFEVSEIVREADSCPHCGLDLGVQPGFLHGGSFIPLAVVDIDEGSAT